MSERARISQDAIALARRIIRVCEGRSERVLFVAEQLEPLIRASRPKTRFGSIEERRGRTCRRGHPMRDAYLCKGGYLQCRTCTLTRNKRRATPQAEEGRG